MAVKDTMNRKGAVPVIATLLLLTIVAASVIVLYAYVSGANVLPDTNEQTGRMLEKLKTVEVKGNQIGQFNVSIMNVGAVDSVIDVFYVQDFSGNTLNAIPVSTSIPVGETRNFFFDTFDLGNGPWSWYEIIGVTDRGNKVRTNLFAFYSGAYELGERPGENEFDYAYNVYSVTTNGVPTLPSNLPNLTAIDGNYFGYNASGLYNSVVTYPTGVYDLDINSSQYIIHGEDPADLTNFGSATVLHFNIHDVVYFMSSIFNGTTKNMKYPQLVVTFIFDLQGSGWGDLSGSFQFYDWSRNEYVTSGNGYYQFNGSTLPMASVPPAVPGYRNVTFSVDTTNLLGENGEWSLLLNMTSSGQDNVKLDYFSVTEKVEYPYGFETIFYYQASGVTDENNVTNILFSTTGIFPPSSVRYWFGVYNYDAPGWNYLGQPFQGSPEMQTCIREISGACGSYIDNSTKIIMVKIHPEETLPASEYIYIDQTRMIIRQVE